MKATERSLVRGGRGGLLAALMAGGSFTAACSGGREPEPVPVVPKEVTQVKSPADNSNRPFHSLGPEMRRTKAPPAKR
jgi:hypothetical protein